MRSRQNAFQAYERAYNGLQYYGKHWTNTGLIGSIKKRDDGMWDAPNISKMNALRKQGLATS